MHKSFVKCRVAATQIVDTNGWGQHHGTNQLKRNSLSTRLIDGSDARLQSPPSTHKSLTVVHSHGIKFVIREMDSRAPKEDRECYF